MIPQSNAYRLLGILQSHAPTATEQQMCTELTWKAESDGATHEDIEKMLVGVLSDGLNYGNWPWSPKTVDEILDKEQHVRSDRDPRLPGDDKARAW